MYNTPLLCIKIDDILYLLVASELADRIIRVERISDRVMAVDLVIGEQIVKVVSCYAPQTGRSQIEKEGFWRQVEGVIMNTDISQEVIVGGDMRPMETLAMVQEMQKVREF